MSYSPMQRMAGQQQLQHSEPTPEQAQLRSLVQKLEWSYVALWLLNPQTRKLGWKGGHWRHSDTQSWNHEQYFSSTFESCQFRTGYGSVGMAYAEGGNIWMRESSFLDRAGSKEQSEFLKRARISTAIFISWSDGVLELGTCDDVPENLDLMETIRSYFMTSVLPTLGQQGSGLSQLSASSMQTGGVIPQAPLSLPQSTRAMMQPNSYASLSPLRHHLSDDLSTHSLEPNSLNQQIHRRLASMPNMFLGVDAEGNEMVNADNMLLPVMDATTARAASWGLPTLTTTAGALQTQQTPNQMYYPPVQIGTQPGQTYMSRSGTTSSSVSSLEEAASTLLSGDSPEQSVFFMASSQRQPSHSNTSSSPRRGTPSRSPELHQLEDTTACQSLPETQESRIEDDLNLDRFLMLEGEPLESVAYSLPPLETGTMCQMNQLLAESTNADQNQSQDHGSNAFHGMTSHELHQPGQTLPTPAPTQKPFKIWRNTRVLAPPFQKKRQDLLRRCINMVKQIPHSSPPTPEGVQNEVQAGMRGRHMASSSSPETVIDGIPSDPSFGQVPPRGQRRPRQGSSISSLGGAVHHGHDEAALNHMMAERRRRIKQKENFAALRKLVPIISKADEASVLGDAIIRLGDLQSQIEELKVSKAESDRKLETPQNSYRELEQPGQVMDVQCCRRQHQVLKTWIQQTLQNFGSVDEVPLSYWINGTHSLSEPSSPMEVTPELKRVLTRAKILSEDCCRGLSPVEVALQHAQRSEEFADTLKEIQWCTSVVSNAMLCRKLNLPSTFKDYPWQAKLGSHEHALLEKAAEEDWQQQMRELEIWKRDHVCSAEDCGNMLGQKDPSYCLAGQLMERFYQQQLKRDPKSDFTDEDLEGENGHKSLLWRFDHEVVKHGRPLGSGAFGSVSEVTWLGFKYAQKIFNAVGLHSLPAEADALVKMSHPHIVKVFAHSEDSLLMDLMCADLHKFMKSRMKGGSRIQPFSLPAAVDLMLQIGDAVSYLHSQKMAHRDLKSANILVNPMNASSAADDDGFVFAKIADFGLVKTKQEITRYSHLTHNVGTRRWMAPEIFRDNMEDDHLAEAFPMKADVYSFGIVCFEILSGEVPYRDVCPSDLYSELTAPIPLRPRLPSSCPTDLASLICACWDVDPRKRPALPDVCRVLRYLKGLPTLLRECDRKNLHPDMTWPFGRLVTQWKTQGPWGVVGWISQTRGLLGAFYKAFSKRCPFEFCEPTPDSIGPAVDIMAFQVHFRDAAKLEISGFNFSLPQHEESVGALSRVSTEWIRFDHPNEFLVQVEGSCCQYKRGYSRVESLSFITIKQKYGPYGRVSKKSTPFSSDFGRVVGFSGYFRDATLLAVQVYMMPNIVECLRQYLEEEDPFV